jgi:hypothetical protein
MNGNVKLHYSDMRDGSLGMITALPCISTCGGVVDK